MISLRLKELRSEKGLTQESLAEKAGVSRQTIISLEKETYVPSLDLAFRLAHILKVPINTLIIWKP